MLLDVHAHLLKSGLNSARRLTASDASTPSRRPSGGGWSNPGRRGSGRRKGPATVGEAPVAPRPDPPAPGRGGRPLSAHGNAPAIPAGADAADSARGAAPTLPPDPGHAAANHARPGVVRSAACHLAPGRAGLARRQQEVADQARLVAPCGSSISSSSSGTSVSRSIADLLRAGPAADAHNAPCGARRNCLISGRRSDRIEVQSQTAARRREYGLGGDCTQSPLLFSFGSAGARIVPVGASGLGRARGRMEGTDA